MVNLTEAERDIFTRSYAKYQESCDAVAEARRDFLRASTETKAILAKTPIAPVGKGVERWDPAKAIEAADALERWADSHMTLGLAIQRQANALRDTTELAAEFVKRGQEELNAQG